jgi:hypothetical protein
VTAAAVALVAVLAAQGAPAAPAGNADARAVFERARREHQIGNYPAAADGFAECWRRTGDPTHLFNTAQSLRLAGRDAEAIAAYRGYLRERPDAGNRALVEAKIRDLEAARGRPRAAPRASDSELVDPLTPEPARRPVPPAALPSAERRAEPASDKPLWKRWWLWTAVGAAVVGGTVVAVAASRGTDVPGTPLGNQGIFR